MMGTQKLFLAIAASYGALAVAIGAFGAHKLEGLLKTNDRLSVFQTGVSYHYYHTFALLVVALLMYKIDHRYMTYAGWCFIVGILLFSGSLYTLSITNIGKFGIITPIGGVLFIAGWVLLLMSTLSTK